MLTTIIDKITIMSNTTIFHPAYSLRKILKKSGMTQEELALRLNMSEKHLSEILNEKKSVTTETALKLEQVFWGGASFWINLQARYDEMMARQAAEENIKFQIPFLDRFKECYRDLVSLNLCKKTTDKGEKVSQLLSFFGVTSLANVGPVSQIAFRKSSTHTSYESVAAWLRVGEMNAEKREVKEFSADKLRGSLVRIRNLTQDMERFEKGLLEIWNDCGVKILFVTHFTHAPVSGAARWIGGSPVVQLSDMGKKYDRLIFTLFHEFGHLLLHSGESFIDEKVGVEHAVKKELEADQFAQNLLIPREFNFLDRFNQISASEKNVIEFAKEVGVHVAVVVWRIQRESGNYRFMTHLLPKIEIQ